MQFRHGLYASVVACLMCLCASTHALADLKGYWSLDEGTGTIANDGSGNNNNGQIGGGTWVAGVRPGSSGVSFSGGTAYSSGAFGTRSGILLGSPPELSTDLVGSRTMSFFYNPNNLPVGARQSLWGKNYAGIGTMNIDANSTLQLYFGPGALINSGTHTTHFQTTTISAADTGPLNGWYHIVHVRDSAGQTQQYFINGQPQTLANWTTFNPTGDAGNPMTIGNGYTGAADGVFDEAAVWDEALSPGKVATIFKAMTDPSNFLYQERYGTGELDEIFAVYDGDIDTLPSDYAFGGFNLPAFWDDYTIQDIGTLTLGDTASVDGGIFLLLDAAGGGLLLQSTPLTPEPSAFMLVGVALAAVGGWYRFRRAN